MNRDRSNLAKAERYRCGYAALLGEPNVGKSTLMNAVLGVKLSIVSAKPQTTRRRIAGFHSSDTRQIIFIDTPGVIRPRYLLQKSMVEAALAALADCDAAVLLLDAVKLAARGALTTDPLAGFLRESRKPLVIGLNKIDCISEKKELLPLMGKCAESFGTHRIVPLSALRNEGVEDLLSEIEQLMPVQPPFYPPDQLSDQPERFFVSEIVREKIFEQYREEIPYSTEVQIVEFAERERGKDFISAEIYVERETQKGILIGGGGAALKRVSSRARRDIEAFLGRPVFLELHVKVREGWRDSRAWLRTLGYDVR